MEELFKVLNSFIEEDGGMVKDRNKFFEELKSECLKHIEEVLKLEDEQQFITAKCIHSRAQGRVEDVLKGIRKAQEFGNEGLLPVFERELEASKKD